MKLTYKRKDILTAIVLYGIGDSIATLLLDEFSWTRTLGVMFIGATVYAFEIPNLYKWIEEKTENLKGFKKSFYNTGLATLYFNPIWVFRHLFFINIFSNQLDFSYKNLFLIALNSFLVSIPISFIGNYIIQNKMKLKYRFIASSIFSGLMAIYYAFSETLFS